MIKTKVLALGACCALFCVTAWADTLTDSAKSVVDTNKKVKTGWSAGVLPAIAYDADLGLQYGGLCNLYNFGDGSRYPSYDHSIYVEISRMTRGSGINRVFYDGKRLIPKLRLTVDASYLQDQAFAFWGFNGYEAKVNSSWMDNKSADYRSRLFYAYDRNMLRIAPDIQGSINEHVRWIAGVAVYRFWLESLKVDALNKGRSDADTLPHTAGLYDLYAQWGIIKPNEVHGGWFNALKTGIVYDTRDNEPNPNRGIWDEVILQYAPSFLGNSSNGLRMSATHRQYITVIKDRLTFCYRIA